MLDEVPAVAAVAPDLAHPGVVGCDPPEFRRKVLDPDEAGRPIRQVAHDLGISEQTIRVRRRQHLIDTGRLPGSTNEDQVELVAACRRITEPEAEPVIHRRAAELMDKVVAPCGRPAWASAIGSLVVAATNCHCPAGLHSKNTQRPSRAALPRE
ncbi:hypothetical protein [Streptomyces macrosporus]|uniref:Uncharacterized protein n=1 Tax=Streptomyces macrosporus TaxID=44032 RepID=A0ABN3KKU0_9ACTN